MINHLGIIIDHQAFIPSLVSIKASTLQQDPPDPTGALDGSVADLSRFLRELVEITGQSLGMHATPVLELQFGDVLTISSLSMNTEEFGPCLLITALLPRRGQLDCVSQLVQPSSARDLPTDKIELLWDADEGRQVVIRKIRVTDLPDERSVMDAVLDTADLAAAWHASSSTGDSRL